MLRHIGVKFITDPNDPDRFGPAEVLYTDLDTGVKLGDGWVKLDKTWIISVQFLRSDPRDEAAVLTIVCNSNANKAKCPVQITDPFLLQTLDVVVVLYTSTDTWDYCVLKRSLWEQLANMGVTNITMLPESDMDLYMAVECVSSDKVVNPIIKIRGFDKIDVVEEQNAFAEIHTRTTIYKLQDGYMTAESGKIRMPYILQKTQDGITALFVPDLYDRIPDKLRTVLPTFEP